MPTRAFLAVLLALHASWCMAEFEDHGEYRIHYTTFASTLIPADVARAHNIVRAENQIVLNVSILKASAPSAAILSGEVTNLLNQRFTLDFDEINESEAIYYLASHMALEQDILRFSILVELPGLKPYPINFLRRYD